MLISCFNSLVLPARCRHEYRDISQLKLQRTASVHQIRSSSTLFSVQNYATDMFRCLQLGGQVLLTSTRFTINSTNALNDLSRRFWQDATDKYSVTPDEVAALREAGFHITQEGLGTRRADLSDVRALLDRDDVSWYLRDPESVIIENIMFVKVVK